MGERNFETPNLGSDLWSMGFDDDLALDAHNNRKMALNSTGAAATNPIGYGDMQHMLLHRFEDDLNEGDISQITDLTNSLPKGDTETAHSFLAKIACHDLTRELATAQNAPISKGIDATTIFGDGAGQGNANNALSHKLPSHPVDVYGRVTLFEGKLVLQLKHFNANTNYAINIGECWLCREKMSNGSQIHAHKHVLQGLFQVNNEFVQMDIDHYIIPEQALEPDPSEVNRNMTPSAIMSTSSSGHSTLAQHVTENRALTLAEDIECSDSPHGSHINLNALSAPQRPLEAGAESLQTPKGNSELQYTETDLNNVLSSAQQSLNGSVTIDSQAFLNSFSNIELRIGPEQGTSIVAQDHAAMMGHSAAEPANTSPSFSGPTPLPSIANGSQNATENMVVPPSGPSALNGMENLDALCAPSSSNPLAAPKNDGFSQHTTYEPNISTSKEHLDNYHHFFSHQYSSYSYDNSLNTHLSKFHVDHQPPPPPPPPPNLCPPPGPRSEVGARKRKSRTQKKPSNIRMKEDKEEAALVEVKAGERTLKAVTTEGKEESPLVTSPQPKTIAEDGAKKADSMRAELKEGSVAPAPAPAKNEFIIPCPFCKMEFSNKNIPNFSSHAKTHKFESSYVFKCPFCLKTIQSLEKYTRHLKIHSEKRHFCSKCDAHYSRPDKLRRHVANTHECQKPFACDVCYKSFSRLDYLKAHKNIHTGKKFECDVCHQFFSSQFNLKTHKKLHTGEKLPFSCEFCEKTFSRKDFLYCHVARDHKNKRFKCEICSKLFSRNDILNRHKVTHDEQRVTYDCEDCGKKFRRKDRLKTHSYAHKAKTDPPQIPPKEKDGDLRKQAKARKSKHQCEICLKFIPSTIKLEKHLRLHETQVPLKANLEEEVSNTTHKCQVCSKSFKTEELLRRHVLRGHCKPEESAPPSKKPAKRFYCDLCPKSFSRSYNLKTHKKTHCTPAPHQCEDDDQVLAELPTVLNASKFNLKRRKRSYLALPKDEATHATSSHPAGMKEEPPSPAPPHNFHLPLAEGFVPISSTHSPYNSHLPNELPIPASSFCASPSSPINLSTEAISAAAYLLAHPFYEGPYQ